MLYLVVSTYGNTIFYNRFCYRVNNNRIVLD